jgi:hypothetical protein
MNHPSDSEPSSNPQVDPTRAYAWFAGVFLLLQGASTLAMRLVPELDRAFPALLHHTRMVPSHSLLHIATALIAFAALRWGGRRGVARFAWGFGTFYIALALAGMASGSPLGLGLQAFDHPFHVLLGGLGLAAVWLQHRRERAVRRPPDGRFPAPTDPGPS